MAFDFKSIQQKLQASFSKGKAPSAVDESAVIPEKQQPEGQTPKKQAKWVMDTKQGLNDIKAVMNEGKARLFLVQFAVVLGVFFGVRFANGKLVAQKDNFLDQISAINIQQTNETDYLANKEQLLQLEPLFPDVAQKNDWLLRRVINFFEKHDLKPNIDGNVATSDESNYTVVSQPVTFQLPFTDAGKLIADMENEDDYIRISEFSITKITDPEQIGQNTVALKLNTVFPKEKYGPRLFKDYAQQLQKMKAAAEAQAAAASAEKEKPADKQPEKPAADNTAKQEDLGI